MGQLILEEAVQLLNQAGIATERGYPQGLRRSISGPVCAVNLQAADLYEKRITVLAKVVSPMKLGAAICEETALQVGAALAALGGQCHVGACDYEDRTGLICADVTVSIATQKPTVLANGTQMQHVESFYASRTMDDTVSAWSEAPWQVHVVEWIPAGTVEQSFPESAFTLIRLEGSIRETYGEVTWTHQKREWFPSGVRQTRVGAAQSMSIT